MTITTVHLTNCWHEESGGIATFYRALMNAAERNRHRLRLIVPGAVDAVVDVNEFCRVYELSAPSSPLDNGYRTLYPTHYLRPESPIQRILASERPDLVEVCDAADYALTRIEAEPAKRPSFWISHTQIHHVYTKVNRFWLPVRNMSTTDVRIGGKAVLTIDYSDYQVNQTAPSEESQTPSRDGTGAVPAPQRAARATLNLDQSF